VAFFLKALKSKSKHQEFQGTKDFNDTEPQ